MPDPAPRPTGEDAALVAVQSAFAGRPGVLPVARGMSHFGEHSIGWLAVAGLGALLAPGRRREWITVGVGAFLAHAAAAVRSESEQFAVDDRTGREPLPNSIL